MKRLKSKEFIVGIVIGVFLGVITNYGVSLLIEPTTSWGFSDFEIELLNYQLRGFEITSYLRHDDFELMIDYISGFYNVSLVKVSRVVLRDMVYEKLLSKEENPMLLASYEMKTIYFREVSGDFREFCFYYWSP